MPTIALLEGKTTTIIALFYSFVLICPDLPLHRKIVKIRNEITGYAPACTMTVFLFFC